MVIERAVGRLCIALLLTSSLAQSAYAQHAASMRLGVTVDGASAHAGITERAAADSTSSRTENTLRGALIGSGIGAVSGVIWAYFQTNKATVTDHSEDGLAYTGYFILGALIGAVVGGVVGFVRN